MTMPMADCHNDLLLAVQFQRDRGHLDPFGDFWLPQLRAGGVVLQVLPIWTDNHFVGEGALRRALQAIETARWMADQHSDDVALVTTAAQLQAAIADGRIALVLAFEGLEPVGADVDLIDTFWHLGVRLASLTWNRRTPFADGQGERETGAGLTTQGVAGMNALAEFVGGNRSLPAFVDHVAHAVELVGPDHVALGIDFLADVEAQTLPAGEQPPDGTFIAELLRPADLPQLGERLVDRLGCDAAARVCSDTLTGALGRLLPA